MIVQNHTQDGPRTSMVQSKLVLQLQADNHTKGTMRPDHIGSIMMLC